MNAARLVVALVCSCSLVVLPIHTRSQVDEFRRLEVTVTAISGQSVYIDHGRDALIEPGDELLLYPVRSPPVIAKIRSISRTSARASLPSGSAAIDFGTRGEILIPLDRARPSKTAKPAAPEAPDTAVATQGETPSTRPKPSWEHTPVQWDEATPLLAPVSGRDRRERPSNLMGSISTSLDYTQDNGDDKQRFFASRNRLRARWENPFLSGGELHIRSEFFSRKASFDQQSLDDTESNYRFDRLSYSRGGVRAERDRWEVGRFLQHGVPEFGVLDGIEMAVHTDAGTTFGGSVGYQPEPTDDFDSGDDLQAALYYRIANGDLESQVLRLGIQKSWHKGKADRDLGFASFRLQPTRRLYLQASSWIDYYNSDDQIKSNGFELTQLHVNAGYNQDAYGFSLFGSRIRVPELLRIEFQGFTPEQIDTSKVRRLGLSSWVALSNSIRLRGRANSWEDENDTGGGGELGIDLTNLLYEGGQVSFAVFANNGGFSSGSGIRASASKRAPRGFFRLSYDITNYEQSNFLGSQEEILHHSIFASYDTSLGDDWSLSLYIQSQLREEQDSLGAGITLQRRF